MVKYRRILAVMCVISGTWIMRRGAAVLYAAASFDAERIILGKRHF